MSEEIDVAELGTSGRQVPDATEIKAILVAVTTLTATDLAPAAPARVPSWRFASRTWGKHAALLRTRPHRPNSF
jgi:hypothetical protein